MTCWATTNADQVPKPRTSVDTTRCAAATGLFVSDRILTGRLDLAYSYYRSVDLNAFQFAKELSQRSFGFEPDRNRHSRCVLAGIALRDVFSRGVPTR